MENNSLTKLRKQCKKILIDLELDGRGNERPLADEMHVNYTQLNMALSGYRNTQRSKELLLQLKEHLESKKETGLSSATR